VYQCGQPSDCLYILYKGTVKIGCHSEDEREVIKQILHPMSVFGEMGLLGEKQRQNYARTLNQPAVVLQIPLSEFRPLLQNNTQLSMGFMHFIGSRLRQAERRLEAMVFQDARQRIVAFLKDTARRHGQKVGFETVIRHSLTQQDIANITGTSRQTVTSVLNELRKADLIYFNRRNILIRDLNSLE